MDSDRKSELAVASASQWQNCGISSGKMSGAKLKEAGIDISFEVSEETKIRHKTTGVNQERLVDLLVKDKTSMTCLMHKRVKAELVTRLAQ
jgi:hypothetical protein